MLTARSHKSISRLLLPSESLLVCVTQIRAKKKQEALSVLTPYQLLAYFKIHAAVYCNGHKTLRRM
jgi:hypothetical protein